MININFKDAEHATDEKEVYVILFKIHVRDSF